MTRYRVEVDLLLCQGHGVCKEECPGVFEVEDQGTGYSKVRVLQEYPAPSLNEELEAAETYCPNRTIRLIAVDTTD